ncbi:MaoC/PaaZ C-terminal domain-containing protein [Ramlibacter albus]|uniref:MaoC family dehydratase N-terminal domain-containing protein n=1 Tax=Ramlibacter albus TaxID=2079448 RepID=A0A923S7D9_9BURK|nr:MaoC/PaaZ C-terminal domain-containing protein [Ramlibacter albus]MBC5767047.1 MaoC family dehydratase N-terminal domain-containing protein [Ramlibacter albus]
MTTTTQARPRGRYFDEFKLGERFESPRRTITQTDIINFACLSGDFNAPHVDFEFCKTQPYGEIIAHGPLVFSIAAGLLCQLGLNDGTIVAMMGVDEWRAHAPVKHGDTIRAVATVDELKLTSSGTRGIVTFRRTVLNQRDETVQSMIVRSMYLCSPR